MRRWSRILLMYGLVHAGSAAVNAQDVTGGDPAGFGPAGVSNGLGYNVKTDHGVGYYTGLYRSFDNTTESLYYSPVFSAMNGAPLPKAEAAGWGFSPPWSERYRQVAAKQPHKFGLFRRHR
jgi:hypothetical protein